MANFFEQPAYTIKGEQLSFTIKELKEENERLKKENESLKKLAGKNDDLLDEITEEWVWELSVCHQAGGKINDFESVMRKAMEAAFYRTQADSID